MNASGLFVELGGHCVDTFTDGAVFGDAVAHALQVVLPLDLMERSEVHQDLAIHSEMEQLADIGLDERGDFLIGQIPWVKASWAAVRSHGDVSAARLAI